MPLRGTLQERSFPSKALKGNIGFNVSTSRPVTRAPRTRYPVVYFLHGLPASAFAFRGTGSIAKAIDAARRPAILVGPQGARDGDSDPEYLDWGTGRNWETALGPELPRYVDDRFRTIAGDAAEPWSVSGQAVPGRLLALHRLDAFSVIESWSGYVIDRSQRAARARPRLAFREPARKRPHLRPLAPPRIQLGGRRTSASTSGSRTTGSATRTSSCTASSPRPASRTCSSSTAAATSRRSGIGTRRPGCGSRSTTSLAPASDPRKSARFRHGLVTDTRAERRYTRSGRRVELHPHPERVGNARV